MDGGANHPNCCTWRKSAGTYEALVLAMVLRRKPSLGGIAPIGWVPSRVFLLVIAAPVAQIGIYAILILAVCNPARTFIRSHSHIGSLSRQVARIMLLHWIENEQPNFPVRRTLRLYFVKHPLISKTNLAAAWFAEILGMMWWAALMI